MSMVYWGTAGTATVELTIRRNPEELVKKTLQGCFVKKEANVEYFVERYIDPSADRNKYKRSDYLFYCCVSDFREVVTGAVIYYEEPSKSRWSRPKQTKQTCTVNCPLIITFDGHFFLCCNSKNRNQSKFLAEWSKEVRINQVLGTRNEFCGLGMDANYLMFISFETQQLQNHIYKVNDGRVFNKLLETGPLLLEDTKTIVASYRKLSEENQSIKISIFGNQGEPEGIPAPDAPEDPAPAPLPPDPQEDNHPLVIHLKTVILVLGMPLVFLGANLVYTIQRNPEILQTFWKLGVQVLQVYIGSVVFVLKVQSISSLKQLWKSYKDGSLKENLTHALNQMEELKALSKGEEIDLEVTIDEKEYHEVLWDLIQLEKKGESFITTVRRQRWHSISCERYIPEELIVDILGDAAMKNTKSGRRHSAPPLCCERDVPEDKQRNVSQIDAQVTRPAMEKEEPGSKMQLHSSITDTCWYQSMASGSDEDDFGKLEQPPKKLEARTINGLVTIDLTNYDVVTFFPDFTSINNLQVIRMPSHSLEDIQGEDSKIPNSFCSMKYLIKLCLFGDNFRTAGLTCLPTDFGRLQSLEELNLQHNNFSKFPDQICKLKNLKKLYLNCCGLISISANISGLLNLIEADFSQNDFSAGLPKELFDLPRLKDLYLIDCKLDHLSPEIGNLEQLEGIRLNDNLLEDLPDEFFNLKYLKKLSANNNRISKISPKIINFQNLKVLMLKENNLKFLPKEISKLPDLQVVNVFDNKLTCLPETITEMQSSMEFVVHGNEYLQKPPLSVCTKGIDNIKGYFESLKKDRPVHSNRIKIVMLGEAGAGKTCLTKALVESKASDFLENDSTIGVEIHHWKVDPNGLEACIVDLAGQRRYQHIHPFFLSEEALHILVVNLKKYQCNKESFKENVEDWIEWVTARLMKPHIMIVPTHKDECDEKQVTKKCADILDRILDHEKREIKRLDSEMKKLEKKKSPLKEMGFDVEPKLENLKLMKSHRPIISSKLLLEEKQAKSKNGQEGDQNYISIVPVSSKEELHGVIPLKEEIKRVAKVEHLFPFIGRDLPESWVTLEEAIKKYRQQVIPPNIPCMTLEDFKEFAGREAKMSENQVVLAALKYLDSVGEIKFYDGIENNQYSVFLDLQWLCKAVKCLFRHDILEGIGLEYKEDYEEYDMEKIKFERHVTDLIDNGVLSVILLRCIWEELQLDDGEFQKLIKALIRFGLACELPRTPQDEEEEKKLLIPWFLHSELNPTKKEEVFPSTPDSIVSECKLKYAISGYLPAGLFDRLCVHSYALGVDASTWKNSMLIYLSEDIKIFLEVEETCITITGRTQSGSLNELWLGLLKIVEDLDSLLKEWPGLVWNTYTVCPHCVKNKEPKPYHFECKWLSGQAPHSVLCKKSKMKKTKIEVAFLVPPRDLLKRLKPSKPVSEIVSDILIAKLSLSLSRDWKNLATYLGLTYDEIDLIDTNERRAENKTTTMLQEWKTRNGTEATRSKLRKELETIGRVDLVDIVKNHQDH